MDADLDSSVPADIISSTDKLGEGLRAASAALFGSSLCVPARGSQDVHRPKGKTLKFPSF